MINDQLLSYVKQQLSLKVTKESISTNLKTQGWTDEDLNEVFKAIENPSMPTSTPVSPVISTMTPGVSQIQTTQTGLPQEVKHGGGKKIFSVIIVLILLGVAGAGVYAYYTGVLDFKKAETFEQVFTKAMDKISSQKYSKNTSEVGIVLKDKKIIAPFNLPAGVYPQINFSSEAFLSREDLNDPFKDKLLANAKFDLRNILKDPILAKIDFLIPEPMVFYVKLSELSGLPEGTPSLSVSLFQGKWWKVDVKALINNFADTDADKLLESIKNNQPSKEKLEKVNIIFKKYLGMAQVEKLADGVVDGAPAYHFSIVFDKKLFAAMLMEIAEVTRPDSTDGLQIETSEIKTEIENALNMIDLKSIEIFAGKRNYIPFQVTISLGISDKDGGNIADVNINYFTSSSAPMNIETPAESTDILYLLGPIVQSSLQTARQKGKEAGIKATLSSMRAQAELFYDSHSYSYSGFCLSKELKDARVYVEQQGGTGFICKDSPTKYSIGTKFPQNSGNWCVDSTGASKATTTLPVGTACPTK